MIIASILLSRRASYLQAVFASVLFLSVSFLEYRGLWDHHCLNMPGLCFLGGGPLPLLGSAAAFVSTLFIAVYMASSITSKLRQKEATLLGANLLLNEKDKIKSNYVLRVSHDVKEHLAAIQACLDPVLHGLTGELNPVQEGLLKRSYARTEKLLVFVRALLEITRIKLSNKMETGPFSLNTQSREVRIHGVLLKITPNEYGILKALMTAEGRVFSRMELVGMVQGYEFEGYHRTIDTHIKNLRKKIAEHLPDKDVIHSVYGTGYRFSLDIGLQFKFFKH